MARKERKVVTVLFADLVGFTARAEELDPEDVEASLTPEAARGALALGKAEDLLAQIDEDESAWHKGAAAILREDFAAAADVFAGLPARPEEAMTRLWAAERLVAEGRRGEAEAQLERALSFWRSVGPRRYVARAEALRAQAATG